MELSDEKRNKLLQDFAKNYTSEATMYRYEFTKDGYDRSKRGIVIAPREDAKYIEPDDPSEQLEQAADEAAAQENSDTDENE